MMTAARVLASAIAGHSRLDLASLRLLHHALPSALVLSAFGGLSRPRLSISPIKTRARTRPQLRRQPTQVSPGLSLLSIFGWLQANCLLVLDEAPKAL